MKDASGALEDLQILHENIIQSISQRIELPRVSMAALR